MREIYIALLVSVALRGCMRDNPVEATRDGTLGSGTENLGRGDAPKDHTCTDHVSGRGAAFRKSHFTGTRPSSYHLGR